MKTAFALLLVLLASAAAFSQERPTVAAQPNSVFVGADGKYEANPPGNRAALRPLSPLRTGLESFPSSGSSTQ